VACSGHEHFNGSIVIPVISAGGEITEVYGRKINEGLRPAPPITCTCRSPPRRLERAALGSAAHGADEIILCEALMMR